MKRQKIALVLFSLVSFFGIAAGCAQIPQRQAIPSPESTNLPVRRFPSTETVLATFPLAPTSTLKPRSMPTVVPTLPTSTPTVIPTLAVEDARQRLLDLLANNGGCKLPCLWGITPGKSSYLEAQSILVPLSGIAETLHFNLPSPAFLSPLHVEDITPIYIEENSRFNSSVVDRLNTMVGYLYGDDNIVSSIGFTALEEEVTYDSKGNWTTRRPVVDSTTFEKRVAYYSLSHVLTEQGIPASVMIQFLGGSLYSVYVGGLDIALLYPDQGIWVHYEMPMQNKGNRKVGCPNGNAQVEMKLFPPGNPNSFYAQLDQTNWGITKAAYKPLEEATTMSVDKFYETFRNPASDQCIQTPTNLWPTPEFESPNN